MVRDAIVFDVLCALRLSETEYCICSHSPAPSSSSLPPRPRFALKLETEKALLQRGWGALVGALGRILQVAEDVAMLEEHLSSLHDTVRRVGGVVDIAAIVNVALSDEASRGAVVGATTALGAAAFGTLFRLGSFARNVLRGFKRWVLEVQETLAFTRSGEGPATGGDADLPCDGILSLVTAVEHNGLAVQRLLHVVEESGCFADMVSWAAHTLPDNSPTHSGGVVTPNEEEADAATTITCDDFADECAELAAGLLDFLIVRLSALQDSSSLDLYRVYMMLLIHCSWPYVSLVTATICGLVRGIDPQRWRQQLPRLFRSSFSHIRAADTRRQYPTDVLSLILNCVGYDEVGHGDQLAALGSLLGGSTKAVAALTSSRRFVLRCFATFGRRKQSRRKDAAATPRSAPGGPAPDLITVESVSVEGILNELVSASGTEEGQQWESLFLPPHVLQQRRMEARQRQLAAEADPWAGGGGGLGTHSGAGQPVAGSGSGSTDAPRMWVLRQMPASVPLAFSTVELDIAGQAAYRRAMLRRQASQFYPGGGRLASAQDRDGGASDAESDEEDSRAGGPGSTATLGARKQRDAQRHGELWALRVSGVDDQPDILLVDRLADPSRSGGDKNLWLNTTIPAARWLAAALLIPIGVVVQRLHERRLRQLLRRTQVPQTLPSTMTGQPPASPFLDEDGSDEDHAEAGAAVVVTGADGRPLSWDKWQRLVGGMPGGSDIVGPMGKASLMVSQMSAPLSFMHAVKLLLDVALCRDKPRLIEGFLERLYREPYWWHRTSTADGQTASSLISFLFADALRGKRHADLVALTVLPKAATATATTSATPSNPDDDLVLPREMLDVFSSFVLHFAFPDELALVLLPVELSMAVRPGGATGSRWEDALERSYSTFFWERRRGRYPAPPPEQSSDHTARPPTGVRMSDVWSYVFGYLCTIHFAQISLREQRKALQIQDTQDHQLLAVLGAPKPMHDDGPRSGRASARRGGPVERSRRQATVELSRRRVPVGMLSRGLGSAYHALGFAVDAIIAFTLREVSAVIYELERLLAQTEGSPSVMRLCEGLDALLLRLQVVSFPARAPVVATRDEAPERSRRSEEVVIEENVRAAIHAVFALALSPNRMPVRTISTRSRNAIEALVALLSAADKSIVQASQLQPLLVVLTFNGFYGWEAHQRPDFQFR